MNRKRIAWLGLLAAVGFGCEASTADGLAEPVAEAELESERSAGPACGEVRCATGEACCDQECGVCAKPGEGCVQGSCRPPAECSSDNHCTVKADYCAGCDCVALGPEEELPMCWGPGVQCLADACLGRKAVCLNSYCTLE